MKKRSILVIVLIISLAGCKKHKSNKELFEKNFKANTEACMKPLVEKGVEPTKAKRICECGLKTMFEIDSTVMSKGHTELEELFDTHKKEIITQCEDLKEFFKDY